MNDLTKSEEERFERIMERTILVARKQAGHPYSLAVDPLYWDLLRQEPTEELEFMVQLHADGKLTRRPETFDVMLEELAERELLGRGTQKQICKEHDGLLQQGT